MFNRNRHSGMLTGMDSFSSMFSADGGVNLLWDNTMNVDVSLNGSDLLSIGGLDNDWTQRNPWTTTLFSPTSFSIEFKLIDSPIFFGIAKSTKTANFFSDIDYAFYREGNAGATSGLSIWENGSQVHVVGIVLENTDILKIDYDGIDVKYYINETLLYTSLVSPSGNYKLKTSLYRSSLANVIVTNTRYNEI